MTRDDRGSLSGLGPEEGKGESFGCSGKEGTRQRLACLSGYGHRRGTSCRCPVERMNYNWRYRAQKAAVGRHNLSVGRA